MEPGNPEQLAAAREALRLVAVETSDIFNPILDAPLKSAVRAGTHLLAAPIGIISVVTKNAIRFRSRVGIELAGTGREPGLDGSAILTDRPWVIEDTLADPLTRKHSLVARANGIRFYAGKAIFSREGFAIGALSILDYAPRQVKENQVAGLVEIARVVEGLLNLRIDPTAGA